MQLRDHMIRKAAYVIGKYVEGYHEALDNHVGEPVESWWGSAPSKDDVYQAVCSGALRPEVDRAIDDLLVDGAINDDTPAGVVEDGVKQAVLKACERQSVQFT